MQFRVLPNFKECFHYVIIDCTLFCLLGLGEGDGRNLLAANISKTITCMPMKFSQIDGVVEPNKRYTFFAKATYCDVITNSSNSDLKKFKKFFSGLFLAVLLTYFKNYYMN